jgi:hypothetical protein
MARGRLALAAMMQIARGDRGRRGGPGIEIVRVVIGNARLLWAAILEKSNRVADTRTDKCIEAATARAYKWRETTRREGIACEGRGILMNSVDCGGGSMAMGELADKGESSS